MKAKIRETGEIKDVDPICDTNGVYLCYLDSERNSYSSYQLDFDIFDSKSESKSNSIEKTIDWEQRRYEIIKDFSSAMMANPKFVEVYSSYFSERSEYDNIDSYQKIAINCATYYADELINQLKEEM